MASYAELTKLKTKSLTFFIFLTTIWGQVQGQNYLEQTNSGEIKTIRLFRTGWEMSQPVIMLNSDEQLTLMFDELAPDVKAYYYSVVHLSAQNEPSQLAPSEYVKAFPHTPIDDYTFSFNTTYSYVHYQVTFPNDDVQLLRSGNYALLVYEDYKADNPTFVKHFKVTEQIVNVDATVKFPLSGIVRDTHQQLNILVRHPELTIHNPMQDVTVVVTQNGRQDNKAAKLKPDFVRPSELAFEYQDALLFEAGNEFRWLDIRSTRFIAEHVQQVIFAEPYYHAQLKADDIKWGKPYFRKDDSNGQYVVSVREYDSPSINADYIFVHFTLPLESPMLRGAIYVYGGLTDWQITPRTQMRYNFENKCYELTMLLKQGFYNYQYVFMENGKTKADLSITEGNHSTAENDYHVYVYYRGPSDYYDRLINYTAINSKSGTR